MKNVKQYFNWFIQNQEQLEQAFKQIYNSLEMKNILNLYLWVNMSCYNSMIKQCINNK